MNPAATITSYTTPSLNYLAWLYVKTQERHLLFKAFNGEGSDWVCNTTIDFISINFYYFKVITFCSNLFYSWSLHTILKKMVRDRVERRCQLLPCNSVLSAIELFNTSEAALRRVTVF